VGLSQNNLKRCRVKIDYHNEKGHVELLLGQDWQVDLHDELIDGLTQWLSEENVKILYN
jgi:DNA polymerase III subunit alpha